MCINIAIKRNRKIIPPHAFKTQQTYGTTQCEVSMEIAATSQHAQTVASLSRQRTAAPPAPSQHNSVEITKYLDTQLSPRYSGSSIAKTVAQYGEKMGDFTFSKGNNIDSILKQAVSFTPQVSENSFEKLWQAEPFREFSASFPQDEQEAAKRYAAAQGSGKVVEDLEDGIKKSIAGNSSALTKLLPCAPGGNKPVDIRTTTTHGTIVTLLTPPVRYNETTAENFSLQVTRKDGFQLTLPLDEDVRMNEEEDGTISLYYPASGKRLTYDAEGNEHTEIINTGEQGTDGDDILINVSGNRIESGSGNDTIFNLTDNVAITGTEGNKTIFMGGTTRKNVSIELGDGNHCIYGNMLKDSKIEIGSGNNTIAMAIIHDTDIKIGNGNNTLLTELNRGISVFLGDGNNTISSKDVSSRSTIQVGGGNNTLNINSISNNTKIDLGDGNNNLKATGINNSSIDCGNGNSAIDVSTVNESALNTGNGNNTVQTNTVYHGSVNVGNGSNTYTADTLFTAQILAGGGKNTIICNTALSSQLFIGNDSHGSNKEAGNEAKHDAGSTITINSLNGSALHTGSGNDIVTVNNKVGSTISTGAGNDLLYLGNHTWDVTENINTGSGHDTVFLKDKFTGQYIDMTHLFK